MYTEIYTLKYINIDICILKCMSKSYHCNLMSIVASWYFKVVRLLDLSGQCYFRCGCW